MDNDENIDDAVVIDDSIHDKGAYGPLSQYMAEPSVSIHQHPDKVFFKLNLLTTDEDTISDVTLEIPPSFKGSLFCQAIIAYCYLDTFKELGDTTIQSRINLFKRFFSFLLTHDKNCDNDTDWSNLVATGNDLPYTVIHEFLLHRSESGTGATSLSSNQSSIIGAIKWASELSVKTGSYNLTGGDKLLPYVKRNVNPEIKKDDITPRSALSQIFTIDYETGEEVQCPYSDSQLVTNLRWFAWWYLDVMRERRLFLRKIMLDEKRTIYEVLTERLDNGTWSLDSSPVKSMFGRTPKDKDVELPLFIEASGMYAKIYDSLFPSKLEIEQIEKGLLPVDLENRLLWLECLGFKVRKTKETFKIITSYHSDIESILKRITESISYNKSYRMGQGAFAEKKIHPVTLRSGTQVRGVQIPNFSLADMIVPTDSECLVMSWLLASECIQWSNQIRLNLTDLKFSGRGRTLNILTHETIDDIDVSEAKIRHHKERGKGGDVKKKAKHHETITYKSGDPLMTTYSNWLDDMTEAQIYLNNGKGKWFHTPIIKSVKLSAIFPLSFLCSKTSLFRTAFEKSEQELKYHSELNGQGAFRWLLSAHVKHMGFKINNSKGVKGIFEKVISIDNVRQSRIIFTESQGITDTENAKETAHNEEQVAKYRETGVAKERILNGIKGHVQVANKMIEEAMSILDSCHIMSVDEVQKSLHDPSGFTVNDVVKFINEIAANPEKYDVTIFGGIIDKADPHAGIKIINDKNSAMMMWSYIKHMESELQSIEENHDEEQVVKHLFEHAQWEILFERFPEKTQQEAKALVKKYTIPYPPLF